MAVSRRRKAAPSVRTEKPPAGRKGTFDKAERVESAFALLSQKVTKEGLCPDTSRTTNVQEGSMIMRRIRRSLPDKGEREIY